MREVARVDLDAAIDFVEYGLTVPEHQYDDLAGPPTLVAVDGLR